MRAEERTRRDEGVGGQLEIGVEDQMLVAGTVEAQVVAAPEADGWLRLYVPVVMLAVLGLAARLAPPKWRATFSDRVILSLLFLPAALFGVTQILAAALTIAVLVSLFRILGPQA